MQSEASISSHSWAASVPQAIPAVTQRPNRLAAMLAITGADLNSRDGAGLTPLHTAVIWGRLDLCQLLLDSGADPNSTDSLGRTPLQLSTHHGYSSVSSLIISRGGRWFFEGLWGLRYLRIFHSISIKLGSFWFLLLIGRVLVTSRFFMAHIMLYDSVKYNSI